MPPEDDEPKKPDDELHPPDWEGFLPALELPHMEDADLKKFVDDFISNRIFTDKHINPRQIEMAGMIFMPLALGVLSQYNADSLKQIGCIWEYNSAAGPRSINGYPIFFSLRLMHVDDGARCLAAIQREEERRKNIEV